MKKIYLVEYVCPVLKHWRLADNIFTSKRLAMVEISNHIARQWESRLVTCKIENSQVTSRHYEYFKIPCQVCGVVGCDMDCLNIYSHDEEEEE